MVLERRHDAVVVSEHIDGAPIRGYELKAEYFAAALLMPEPWFSCACQDYAPGLAPVKQLARLCGTSLTATAKRHIDTTTRPVALILSTGHTIDFGSIVPWMPRRLATAGEREVP